MSENQNKLITKRSELIVKEFTIEEIYAQINMDAENGRKLTYLPKSLNITAKSKERLMDDGFAISYGVRFGEDYLIIHLTED